MLQVSDRVVRHLVSTGYLSPKSKEDAVAIAITLRLGLATMSPEQAGWQTLLAK
jgi:hypothetical protein